MRDRWDWRALVFFVFIVTATAVVVNQITGLHDQVGDLHRQLDTTNTRLTDLARQVCEDANASLRQAVAVLNIPNPVYRNCR